MDEKDYLMSDGDFLFNKSAVVDELKDIYTTLDGPDDVSDINSIEEMVEKVAEVASGGGGGDFTQATLTVKNNSEDNITLYCPMVTELNIPGWPKGTYIIPTTMARNGNTEILIALAKKVGSFVIVDEANSYTISYTGDMIYGPDTGVYIAFGNCTLTISDKT